MRLGGACNSAHIVASPSFACIQTACSRMLQCTAVHVLGCRLLTAAVCSCQQHSGSAALWPVQLGDHSLLLQILLLLVPATYSCSSAEIQGRSALCILADARHSGSATGCVFTMQHLTDQQCYSLGHKSSYTFPGLQTAAVL